MCMIIDANRLGLFLADPVRPDAAPIRRWLDERGGRIVYSTGGGFAEEVVGTARTKLLAYSRAGKAVYVPPSHFQVDADALAPHIRSDDPHVLALARATGVRLLYTGDGALIDDFKDRRFIKPRGSVYSRAANARLLTRSACARLAWRGNH
jgi:hypothetical protein